MSRRWRLLLLPLGFVVEAVAACQVAAMAQFDPRAALARYDWWMARLPSRDWYFGDAP